MPGVSFTYLRRDLPDDEHHARRPATTTSRVTGIKVKTTAWRAVASKSLGFFGLAAGAGQDKYDSRATRHGARERCRRLPSTAAPYAASQKVTRTNMFADLSLNFPFFKLAAEIGRVSGGTIDTYNTFSGTRADDVAAPTLSRRDFGIGRLSA